jgi:hypothetical protein
MNEAKVSEQSSPCEAPEVGLPDFRGKVVLIFLRQFFREHDFAYRVAVRSPRFERQGGRLFLLGPRQPPRVPRLGDESVHAVAWEAVEQYVIFDSEEQYWAQCCPEPDRENIPF